MIGWVRRELLVVGRCWKKDGWVVSVYQRIGDPYITMKVRKVKNSDQMGSKSKIQVEKHAGDSNAQKSIC